MTTGGLRHWCAAVSQVLRSQAMDTPVNHDSKFLQNLVRDAKLMEFGMEQIFRPRLYDYCVNFRPDTCNVVLQLSVYAT